MFSNIILNVKTSELNLICNAVEFRAFFTVMANLLLHLLNEGCHRQREVGGYHVFIREAGGFPKSKGSWV